jgi:N-dimethylarginine dimethylaminohydrolase
MEQHRAYERCLAELGCEVRRLPAGPKEPDAVFIEDTPTTWRRRSSRDTWHHGATRSVR